MTLGEAAECVSGAAASHIYFNASFITNYIELSPSWETTSCLAAQKVPKILCNPKVHYFVQKSPSLVPILSQINPVDTTPFYISKILFNTILPPTSRFS
jgi:hypothetical protein